MIRQYKNKRIEKNFKITNVLFIISIFLSVLTVIIYLITRYVTKTAKVYASETFFYTFALATPIVPMLFTDVAYETKNHNAFSIALGKIIVVHIEVMFLIFFSIIFGIIAALDSTSNYYSFGFDYYMGYCFIAHSFSYVASYILIYNCVLIKREWKENPPDFAKQEYAEKEQQKAAKKTEQDKQLYLALIEKCGIGFFIKYYRQISRLPLKDVNVTESYSSAEREERLLAAKKIINLGLSELALTEIIRAYDDILDKEVIDLAKELLAEIRKPD